MIGSAVSHYQISELLGVGGMGVVYRAEDKRLDRSVALKFLADDILGDRQALERFQREARAASALNHPNISIIHDVGEHSGRPFIVMEHVDGRTLSEMIGHTGLSADLVIDLAIQVCDALEHAHAKGILHRDIKPSNILVTTEGRVKVLDFGLAKLRAEEDIATTALTIPGSISGTVAYMSPEQARGEEVDAQSDIFSLGATIFEMLTGRQAFEGATAPIVFHAILEKTPPSTHHPRLDRIIEMALQKDKRARYLGAAAMRADLLRLKSDPTKKADTHSIAVLPFSDMSPQRDQEYFCDGIAEELITALANVDRLQVTARTSAFAFKGQQLDVRTIGEKLGVDTVLEGSVRKAGTRLRVTAQLINVSDGFHLWSERYDREIQDIFDIQDDITETIVSKLRAKLGGVPREPLIQRCTSDCEAYNLYLLGRHHWDRRENVKAIQYFEQAVQLDPEYALAWVGLADACTSMVAYAPINRQPARDKALGAAMRALELNDNLAEAHFSMGLVNFYLEWHWSGAEKELRRAIELNPNLALAHAYLAYLLALFGKRNEAIRHAEAAQSLDPLSITVNSFAANAWFSMNDYARATLEIDKVLEAHPVSPLPLAIRLQIRWRAGDTARLDQVRVLESVSRESPYFRSQVVIGYIRSGHIDQALQLFAELQQLFERYGSTPDPAYAAFINWELGDAERAREYLEAAFENRSWLLASMNHPYFDSLRADPFFEEVRRRMNFPSSRSTMSAVASHASSRHPSSSSSG